ncbi:unnamed protein product [Phaeothamnion confervicola]
MPRGETMYRLAIAFLAAGLFVCGIAPPAQAQLAEGWTPVPFPGRPDATFRARVAAPAAPAGKLAAVVVAHGSGGIDGRANAYVVALRDAGIATLEIEMFASGGRPDRLQATYPHVLGALAFLAANPAIDPARIGLMGFSWGGGLGLAMAQEGNYPPGSTLRYAALMPFYPVCNPSLRNGVGALTGRPVLILAGGRDDYDASDDCPRLAAMMNTRTPGAVDVHVYPDATHIWDTTRREPFNFYDRFAMRGAGGQVRVVPDAATKADSVARTVSFFAAKLGTAPR